MMKNVKMQRRHFEEIASALKMAEPPRIKADAKWYGWYETCVTVANNLAHTNARFDKERFIHAATGV